MMTVQLVEQFKQDGWVVGFDIAGDEAGYPVTAHQKAFEYAHQKGIPCTAHAGEACGPSSVWDVLNHFHPSRIGHGVRSTEDSQLLTHLREKNIHLEVCPSSNLRTNVYSSYAAHVIDKLYKEGISVSVNTDARTVTPVTLSGEYASIAETFGWTLADFLACNLQAVDHCFAPAAIKEQLRKQLLNSYS
jgi:adenosine deaminase